MSNHQNLTSGCGNAAAFPEEKFGFAITFVISGRWLTTITSRQEDDEIMLKAELRGLANVIAGAVQRFWLRTASFIKITIHGGRRMDIENRKMELKALEYARALAAVRYFETGKSEAAQEAEKHRAILEQLYERLREEVEEHQ